MRPGAPLGFGTLRGVPWLGLPGNPVSAMVTFEIFARPVIRRLRGERDVFPHPIAVRVRDDVSIGAPLTHFMRAIVTWEDGARVGASHRTAGLRLADVDVARQRVARRAARPAAHPGRRDGARDPARRSRALVAVTRTLRNRVAELSHEVDELQASLDRRFRVTETRVDLPTRTFVIRHPANSDDLISEEDFVRDDRLPYWADIWPSSRALAARLLEENGTGRSLVELGCGSGLVSTAAASVGFDVVATDYYEDALLFARLNANRNAGRDIGTRLLDWRDIAHDVESVRLRRRVGRSLREDVWSARRERVRPAPGARWIRADGRSRADQPRRFPEFARAARPGGHGACRRSVRGGGDSADDRDNSHRANDWSRRGPSVDRRYVR